MKTINNFSIIKKNIILRVDLNVPVVDGVISDITKIISIKSTIKKLIKTKNKVFLVSHFGRPKGEFKKNLSLKFICHTLSKQLAVKKVHFINSFRVEEIENIQKIMQCDEICLFENIRFYQEEENNDLIFSKKIAKCFDVFINDAFSASHRSHASIVGITNYLPSLAGDNLIKEIKNLDLFLNNPKKPITAIIGGSKISTKIKLLKNLVKYFDNIILCGAMANTFLLAKNYEVGKSMVEINLVNIAKEILLKGKSYNCNLILPIDVVSSTNIRDSVNIKYSSVENVNPDQMILDIGKKSITLINKIISESNMILWNGPPGAFEYKPFDHSTKEIASTLKKYSVISNIVTLAGGGDTVSAIKMAKAENGFSYISNAGGAFLEWLEGKELPGIKALRENKLD